MMSEHTTDPDVREIKTMLQRLIPVVSTIATDVTVLKTEIAYVKADVARVEVRLTGLELTFQQIKVDLAELKGRVSQLPTTVIIIGFALTVMAMGGFLHYFGPR